MLRCGRGGHEIVNVSFHEGSHSHCPANLCLLLRLLAGDRRPPVRRRLRSSQGSGGVPPRAPWTREGPAFRVHTHAWPPFADGGRRLAVDSLCPTDEIIALCITPAHAATDSSPRRMWLTLVNVQTHAVIVCTRRVHSPHGIFGRRRHPTSVCLRARSRDPGLQDRARQGLSPPQKTTPVRLLARTVLACRSALHQPAGGKAVRASGSA